MAKSVGKKESKMVNKIRRSVSNEFVPPSPSPSRWRVNFERRKEETAVEMVVVVVVVVMVMESDEEEEEDIALLAVTPSFLDGGLLSVVSSCGTNKNIIVKKSRSSWSKKYHKKPWPIRLRLKIR